jgi:L-aspartate oxidase
MEMVQFHPTTLYAPGYSERLFLISEAVRGEGGILRNHKGENFMEKRHAMASLAPRDIVTRGILAELEQNGEEFVYLDVSSMDDKFFSRRFPTIYAECHEFGIKVPFDAIPVRPAQHYQMGGVKTDLNGMTCIEGLYACGETASTGIHGGNRLASNSLLECLVFGRRAAQHVCAAKRPQPGEISLTALQDNAGERVLSNIEIAEFRRQIRTIMTRDVAAIRTNAGLTRAHTEIGEIFALLQTCALKGRAHYELYAMAQTAMMIIEGALARKESVGAHYLIG